MKLFIKQLTIFILGMLLMSWALYGFISSFYPTVEPEVTLIEGTCIQEAGRQLESFEYPNNTVYMVLQNGQRKSLVVYSYSGPYCIAYARWLTKTNYKVITCTPEVIRCASGYKGQGEGYWEAK